LRAIARLAEAKSIAMEANNKDLEWARAALRRLLVACARRAADDLEAAVRRLRQWAW
jgi:hypothetical protein